MYGPFIYGRLRKICFAVIYGKVKARGTEERERKQGQWLLMCAVSREGGLGGVEGVKSDLCCDWLISMLKW